MVQHTLDSQLAPQDREVARTLWDALVFAPSSFVSERARRQLVEAPPVVQKAIIHEIVLVLRQGEDLQTHDNPFA